MFGVGAPSKRNVLAAALDAQKANVMIANHDLTITYVNPALLAFLRHSEDELRQVLPRFSVATLIGSNIDVFHKNPSHQRNMLAKLETTHNATIHVGKHAFDLVISPMGKPGKRIGFVVEWADANARLANVGFTALLAAVGRSQATIEFTPDGLILTANDNFLNAVGYRLDEVVGKHHSMFVEPAFRVQPEYRDFWEGLGRGALQAGQFRRFGKSGKEVWLQASYNPIMVEGKVVKVLKVATDVTATVHAVQTIGGALSALSEGDLEQRLTEKFPADLEKLRTDLNLALSQLQGTMQTVVQTAQGILGGSGEITAAADSLLQRTEQQAAALEQTAAALDQITATVRATATGAKHAREVVARTKADAEHSGDVVRQAVLAMAEIEKSSSQIGQIIGVIDEIAFQTNLLALNAGVEAARAGDAGRGFAVVASEVRALAQRSADAAREIKALISASSQQVGAGVKLVGETGQVLSRIVTQVAEINGVVADIDASAQEQSVGLAEVNTAVNSIDQVTQRNAAMVEESTAASHALAGEAQELSRLIGRFRLGAGAERPSASAASAPPRMSNARKPAPKSAGSTSVLKVVRGGGSARAAQQHANDANTDAREWTEF